MRLPTLPTIANPYLADLTTGERNLRWLWVVFRTWLILWIISRVLIWVRFLQPRLGSFTEAVAFIGLPLSILAIVVFLVIFVFMGATLTFSEARSDQLALLRLTNVSQDTIFWSLVLGAVYRTCYWLTWIIGGFPYFLWLLCQWYEIWALRSDLRCFTSPLGHTYCYSDGPTDPMRLLELFWFMSITIAVACLFFLAILCAVGFTLKSKNALLSGISVLAFILPVVLGLILIGAPEGFLAADTAYGGVAMSESLGRILAAGILVAVLPFVAALVAQRLLRKWVFK
jgi:hypothetical protein